MVIDTHIDDSFYNYRMHGSTDSFYIEELQLLWLCIVKKKIEWKKLMITTENYLHNSYLHYIAIKDAFPRYEPMSEFFLCKYGGQILS